MFFGSVYTISSMEKGTKIGFLKSNLIVDKTLANCLCLISFSKFYPEWRISLIVLLSLLMVIVIIMVLIIILIIIIIIGWLLNKEKKIVIMKKTKKTN